jgi:TetR/AcrR family transcriptional repressor of nem operon
MRYAPDHKQKTRAKILDAAGKVFRRQGYHASGVDQVMDEAGLTAGGFYTHFDSKHALLAEAITHAGVEIRSRRQSGLENLSGRAWLTAFLTRYLKMSHCREIQDGCPLAALVSEVARADEPVKQSFESLVRQLESQLACHTRECDADAVSERADAARQRVLAAKAGAGAARERALAALALCVGGLSLARAVHDESLAKRILASCRRQAEIMVCGETRSPRTAKMRRRRKDV